VNEVRTNPVLTNKFRRKVAIVLSTVLKPDPDLLIKSLKTAHRRSTNSQ